MASRSLREGGRGSSSSRSAQRLRRVLAAAQVALVAVLLTSSGLRMRSFVALQRTDLGFVPENLLVAELSLAGSRYRQGGARGVLRAALRAAAHTPRGRVGGRDRRCLSLPPPKPTTFTIEGRARSPDIANVEVPVDPVTPDYFRTMGIPLRHGRVFTPLDADTAAPPPVITNETMARPSGLRATRWAGASSTERRIAAPRGSRSLASWPTCGAPDTTPPWATRPSCRTR